jgi:lipid-binding SYLF domain-containing protein
MKRFRAVGKIALIAAAVMIAGAVASEPTWAAAKSAKQINSEVNACLDRFYRQVPGSKELAAQAKGMLVMPKVIKAGLIVGGEYGEGALRIDKKSAGYYNLASGSVGFQIGAEEKDIVILFMTDEAIEKFKNTRGWEAGVDANVAMATVGAGNRIDFTKMYDPIVAFVFDVKGVMADISLKGAKFTKINPK